MNSIIVRPAQVEDAEALSVLNFAFNQIERAVSDIEKSLSHNAEIVMVAEIEGVLVGFGCAQIYRSFCYGHVGGEITEMYVQPNHRRSGVASALIHELEKRLRELDADVIKILTGASNKVAKIAYQKEGYRLKTYVLLSKLFSSERKNTH